MSKPWYAAFTEDGSRWTAGPESLNDALDRAAFFETLGKGRVSFGQTKPGGARTLPFVMPIENVHKLLAAGGHKPPSQGGYQNLKSYRKRNANPRDRFSTAPRKKAAAWRVHPDGRGDRMYANGVSADVYKTSISPALWQSVVYGLTGGPQRSPIMGSSQEVRDWADAKARTYRVLNPSRERGAEIAHALFGGPKRKVTKRFLKDEKVGWNGFAVKVVKYGKDQTCIIGTGVSERCVPTSSIEDITSHEWNSRWDKQWNGKKANPKRNPWTYPTDPGAMFTHYLKIAEERNQDWDGSNFTRENQEAYLSNAAEALAGMKEFGRKVSTADVARLRKAQADWKKLKAIYEKYIAIPHNKRPGAFSWYLEDRAVKRKKNPGLDAEIAVRACLRKQKLRASSIYASGGKINFSVAVGRHMPPSLLETKRGKIAAAFTKCGMAGDFTTYSSSGHDYVRGVV